MHSHCTPIMTRPSSRTAHISTHLLSCLDPSLCVALSKIDIQSKIYEETLDPIRNQYGYQAALWCAMYSLGMTGAEYDPNDTQPNNPNIKDWYAKLMCPWNVDECGKDDGALSGNEQDGVEVCPWNDQGNPWKCAPNQHPPSPQQSHAHGPFQNGRGKCEMGEADGLAKEW